MTAFRELDRAACGYPFAMDCFCLRHRNDEAWRHTSLVIASGEAVRQLEVSKGDRV
ncbi:MAG: hypothetical protein M0R03_02870 [Novosphingobium sp.]|nr:hypothetical protein [Novosphingobium sp.]